MKPQELSLLLRGLLDLPTEQEWVEFKLNNSDPQEVGEYLSALSNAARLHGQKFGYLVFGVQDTTHTVVGTTFDPKREKKGHEDLEAWWSRLLSPRVDFKVHTFEIEGAPVVLFQIDPAPFRPVAFSGTEYVRVGSYKKPLKEYPEKERKLWGGAHVGSLEASVIEAGCSADDVVRLIDYVSFFELRRVAAPTDRHSILRGLADASVIVRDGATYAITYSGALLFARQLKDFAELARKAVRVVVYEDKGRTGTKREQQGEKGYAVGFKGLIGFVNDLLPQNEQIGQALRQEVRLYPEIAIRELVANALVHQDLAQRGTQPMVEIFSNRLEITNNGKPLVDPLRFLDQTQVSRNEVLASMMRDVGICEERGSGIDKVVDSAELYQLPPPDFREEDSHTKAILYAPRPLAKMDRRERVRACYQHASLRYVGTEATTNATLRKRFGIADSNYPVASDIINETIKEGLIKPLDPESKSRRYASYIPFWAP